MFNSEALQEKWQPVLNHPDLPAINDSYKRAVTAVILENQEKEMKESRSFLTEAEMSTADAVANWDPVLISLVRRSMPNLMAYDICGVQPMSGPTGLIFAMKARMGEGATSVGEALFDEADTADSNSTLTGSQAGAEPGVLNDSGATAAVTTDAAIPDIWGVNTAGDYNVKGADTTAAGEAYGASGGTAFQDMGFTIEKATVTARTRALRAAYTMELAQDLKAIHGLDAESELSNILSTEILAEINREVVRTIYITAKEGAQTTADPGIMNLDTDSNGRWSVEKFKGLMFQIERDCNDIGILTRRGKGNIVVCSADVASALSMAGVLDVGGGANGSGNMNVDPSPEGSTFAGTINGRIKVFVDPYNSVVSASAANNWYVAGYRGSNAYDAGLFYCPYVPLQMVRAVSETTFQPRIAFKTRYGMAVNPMSETSAAITAGSQPFTASSNTYYRRVRVSNLM
ncbi:MAG TPA: ATP-binding protein [Marine Group III euryarchaeote]|jgi:hypothetical protein|uniref:ATP-binding protein n=1 Tax=Marine Group III euryarchaeote TaxID=2173149 RepID=A0A7J4GR13_9ARCH|nr:ATP-binding protein [Marine Group III euryarchaeote]